MRIRGTLIALVVVGLAALAGCSEDDPVPKMPKTSAASPTPSPTTSPTPLSEAEEAEALIREWAELDSEMQNTGETRAYLAIANKCETCRNAADSILNLYKAGGQIESSPVDVLGVKESPRFEAGEQIYEARLSAAPSRYKESADGPWKRIQGGNATYDFELVIDGAGLAIRQISTVPS